MKEVQEQDRFTVAEGLDAVEVQEGPPEGCEQGDPRDAGAKAVQATGAHVGKAEGCPEEKNNVIRENRQTSI